MHTNRPSWPFRAISLILAAIQSVFAVIPVAILTSASPRVYAATPGHADDNSQPRIAISLPPLHVKRTILPHFSSPPTDTDFFSVNIFPVPLVPVGTTKPEENQALANALASYVQRSHPEDRTALLNFMQQYPHSAWKPALLVNLGIIWRETGYFSRAKDAWAEAWNLSKDATETRPRALADRALAELAQLYAWIGGYDELQPLFNEIGNRKLLGGSQEMLIDARDGLAVMNNSPQAGFLCGPFALQQLLARSQPGTRSEVLLDAKSTRQGVSLAQLQKLADQSGMDMQMAKRTHGSEFIIGSVVHWKLNHYGALLEEDHGHYLIGDATFSHIYGKQLWISEAALEEESDGYFLVPKGTLPAGWRKVTEEEGKNVWGKGTTTARDNDFDCKTCNQNLMAGGPDDDPQSAGAGAGAGAGGGGGGGGAGPAFADNRGTNSSDNYGMPGYQMTILDAGLYITDTPLRYHPPVGPDVKFKVTYNQRDPYLSALANYSNLGLQWSFNWFTYINDDGSGTLNSTVTRYDNNEGLISYSISNVTTGVYFPDRFGNVLQYSTTSQSYTLTFPDGSQQVFGQPTALAPGSVTRMVFLTSQSDPAGNALTLNYDSSNRLAYVNDALGHTTQLFYVLRTFLTS